MRKMLTALLLLPLPVLAASLQQRVCFPSQQLKACLYQDARIAGSSTAGFGSMAEGDDWQPPLLGGEVRVFDAAGRQTARLKVGRLVDMKTTPLSDQGKPVLLLLEDHSAGMGSYSGAAARPFTVGERGLVFAQPAGQAPDRPFALARTLKSDWKQSRDGFLQVSCMPDFPAAGQWDGKTFRITYQRLRLRDGQWTLASRSERGFWESDGDFPAENRFPR
ncbi:hypothetical protein [uncultured Aquitalea sp.]|uniref:hypothetical protein n=1 Tax=uncultured Aquitalea sp. TaxID=540272 RepID=UPI0025DE0F43|nr:hypothetical protein [uncultured Aquitalea sp.]